MMSLESILRLGWAFARTIVRNRLSSGSELARVISQYRPEGMLSFAPEDHGVMMAAGRCTLCGQCDAKALVLGVFDALGPRGPMAFVVGSSRKSGLGVVMKDEVNDQDLEALTRGCPVGVDFVPLRAMVRRRRDELAGAIGVKVW